ncbi:hypothetical protein A3752_17855 [Oleiphilus sp. HI0081]|jgi:type IV pilus assembly protein PilV|uniref:type IV pilus modification protein PilV n=2 Tax=Oleiphilus TaxID=141450 RepID=UPI0007C2BE51|nr:MULTISPECIES: type IV pilus modification protein PilV [unclassified Oleiphilus]KZY89005.1 hypothetical protein A3743_09675 [Oleiphilus sp. HI0072]KZZ30005.1 hypothetical protein A3752_17855 [Oleiphilus sp. HI0081]KZY29247.1 hypothetical protein A3729_22595 [Oleiphilus sp. HI0043]KZY30695.1 hypothetical protein A3729_01120 [Oleiphilus sp. HI0043]KZZ64143.1 hypothetical protein A3763_05890 [Oleiphilus sp. HI0128]
MSSKLSPYASSAQLLQPLSPKHQGGFTLIEILVAIVILSIGLLGVASLQVQGLRNNQSAYLRSQASLLVYDMADRMRTNADEAIAGAYDGFDSLGTVPSDPGCINSINGCSEARLADNDLFEWAQRLNGTDESAILLPDARGRIIRGDNNLFTIEISWNETQWDDETQSNQVSNQTFLVNLVL